MKKQELIHLHGLFGEIRSQYQSWNEDTDLEHWNKDIYLEDYEELGVGPTNIHKSKIDHKAAVFKLAEGLTGEKPGQKLEPYDREELYQVLEENAEPAQVFTQEGQVSRPRVNLTVDVMTAMNQVIGNWNLQDELGCLEQRDMIESGDDNYEVGADLYLKV